MSENLRLPKLPGPRFWRIQQDAGLLLITIRQPTATGDEQVGKDDAVLSPDATRRQIQKSARALKKCIDAHERHLDRVILWLGVYESSAQAKAVGLSLPEPAEVDPDAHWVIDLDGDHVHVFLEGFGQRPSIAPGIRLKDATRVSIERAARKDHAEVIAYIERPLRARALAERGSELWEHLGEAPDGGEWDIRSFEGCVKVSVTWPDGRIWQESYNAALPAGAIAQEAREAFTRSRERLLAMAQQPPRSPYIGDYPGSAR